jgi:hypothetical protein
LAFVGVIVQTISYKNGVTGTSMYILTRVFGYYQTVEYGISLGEIIGKVQITSQKSKTSQIVSTASTKALKYITFFKLSLKEPSGTMERCARK